MCGSQGCFSQDLDGFSGNPVRSLPSPTLKVVVEATLTSNKVPIIECFSILHQVLEVRTSQEYIGEHLVDGR
jgi:hypothetical protein